MRWTPDLSISDIYHSHLRPHFITYHTVSGGRPEPPPPPLPRTPFLFPDISHTNSYPHNKQKLTYYNSHVRNNKEIRKKRKERRG